MKSLILDIVKYKKFSDEKPRREELWKGRTSRVNIISLKPGQEIKPHTHGGDHIWIVLEGRGEFLSADEGPRHIDSGKIVIAPEGLEHGIRNNTKDGLVFASITV